MTAPPSDPDPRVLHLPTGETIRILATGRGNGGAALEVDALLPPGLAGPPRHRHRTQTESCTVQEGQLQVVVGRDTRVLLAGETVTVPPTVTHGFSNPFDEPARIRVRETPARPLEEQFRALAGSGRIPPIGGARHDQRAPRPVLRRPRGPGSGAEPVWRLLARVHRVRLRLSSPARR